MNRDYILETVLPNHDLVFKAPICDPLYGLPLGNGSMGALVHFTEDALHIHINHTDLIDDIETRTDGYCSTGEETNSIPRSGAELVLDFGCPVFGQVYQQRFEARLSLADAAVKLSNETPFIKTDAAVFVSEKYNLVSVTVKTEGEDAMPLTAELKRWGSRTFKYWYHKYRNDMRAGLDGTDAFAEGNRFGVVQQFNGTAMCLCAEVSDKTDCKRLSGHAAAWQGAPEKTRSVTLNMAIGIAEETEQARRIAEQRLDERPDDETIFAEHKAAWADFWSKSYVTLPRSMDYLENLWYLNLYYANCEMRGSVPPHFCNGIWNNYHDFVPWNLFFHYNSQLSIFPLEAAGHPELTDTYFRFRRNQLGVAEQFARDIKHARGAFYTDVSDFKGRMEVGTGDNCTCGSQIAMYMYSHYLYTGDEDFLNETALPLMRATGEYYLDKLVSDEQGVYHIYNTQGYEGSPLFNDSITDLCMIRALFAALVDVLPEDEAMDYAERLEHLVGFTETDFLPGELDGENRILGGLGKGLTRFDEKVLSVGENGGKLWRNTFVDQANAWYGFPDTEMAPLFPSGLIGVKDKNTRLFKQIQNSLAMHPEVTVDAQTNQVLSSCMGWCMMPIYLARAGMTELLKKQFEQTISGWVCLPQGMGYYTPSDRSNGVLHNPFHQYDEEEQETREKTRVTSWNFRHLDYETVPVLATAVNEALLQSYDGIVRLFPAVSEDDCVSFCLMARGGFKVEAKYARGAAKAVITSTRGGTLKLAADRVKSALMFMGADGQPVDVTCGDGAYTIETEPGDVIMMATVEQRESDERGYARNEDVKTLGLSKLGTEREF